MKKGQLTLITGCMFSGKTTKVIALAQQAIDKGKRIAIYYPEIDTRYTKNYITSHDMVQLPSTSLPTDTVSLPVTDRDLVFIDEVHFFKESIIVGIQNILATGVAVVVSGLDKNFRGEGFGIVPKLLAMADNVITLEAKCVLCQKPATFSQRIIDDHFASKDDKTIVVGGEEMYEARCSEHFIRPA